MAKNVTIVKRLTVNELAAEMYVTIQGEDKLLHKIGFKNGVPVTEKLTNSEVVQLTHNDIETYLRLLTQFNSSK